MADIKAIETQYKGYRFRSRLEARWAVFFDALGIEWEYEKEGLVLSDGTWYLPDFWLPQVNGGIWVEIKPGQSGHPSDWDWPDHPAFGGDTADGTFLPPLNNFILLKGNPWFLDGDRPAYVGYVSGDFEHWFCQCPKCGKVGIEYNGRGGRVCGKPCCGNNDKWYNYDSPLLLEAYAAAKLSRFEHGESGAPQ